MSVYNFTNQFLLVPWNPDLPTQYIPYLAYTMENTQQRVPIESQDNSKSPSYC